MELFIAVSFNASFYALFIHNLCSIKSWINIFRVAIFIARIVQFKCNLTEIVSLDWPTTKISVPKLIFRADFSFTFSNPIFRSIWSKIPADFAHNFLYGNIEIYRTFDVKTVGSVLISKTINIFLRSIPL